MSRTLSRSSAAIIGVLVAVMLLAACGSSHGGSGSSSTWINGIIAPKGDAGFEFMARQRGYFARLGVHVQIETFQGDIQLAQALVAGAIDSAELNPTAAFKADLHGADLRIIGSTLPGLTHDIFARASIRSVRDLPGKTVAVSSPGSLADIVVRAVMATEGLNPNSIHVVSIGSDAARIEAVEHGRVDATAASAEAVPALNPNSGVHVIATSQQVIPEYPRLIVVARGDSLRGKPDAAAAFLAGEMEGIRYALTHPQAERAVAAAILHRSPSDPGIVYIDKLITSAHAASPTAAIPLTNLRWLIRLERRIGILHGDPDLGAIVDSAPRRRALSMVGGG